MKNQIDIWENYFLEKWERANGRAQTRFFMGLILNNIPEHIFDSIKEDLIVDWGCAMGDGTNLLSERLPNARIFGYDRIENAIKAAKIKYPNNNFTDTMPKDVDAIFISNCLEHFLNPLSVIKEHLRNVKKYYIILVPLGDVISKVEDKENNEMHLSHVSKFDNNTLPEELSGFKKICSKTLNSGTFWSAGQLLVVYEKLKTEN